MANVEVQAGIRDRMSQRLDRMNRSVERHGRTWRRTGRMASGGARLLNSATGMLGRGMRTLWRRGRLALTVLTAIGTYMAGQAVRSAMDFERSLRNVTSLMTEEMTPGMIEKRFQTMGTEIRKLAVETGAMPQDLATGMYDIVSTGFDAAAGMNVLEAASVGAFAGLTDVETTTGLLTQTLQAYRQEGESAADISTKAMDTLDKMFQAVNVGVFEFEELASSFGEVAATGAAFNVPLEDMLAFLSTATLRGLGMDEAITGLRQTILSVGDATPAVRKAAEELFGGQEEAEEKFGATAMAADGLFGVLSNLSEVIEGKVDDSMIQMAEAMEENGSDPSEMLAEKLGMTAENFAAMFPNIRALKTVLAVTGPGLEQYGGFMEDIADSSGVAGRAQEEMAKSAAGSLQFLKAAWETFKIDVGNIALPFIKNIADNMMQWWGQLPERFAAEGGFMGDIAEDELHNLATSGRIGEVAQGIWDEATPAERISFLVQTAWSDALDNLRTWFDGGGKEKLEDIGEKIGSTLGEALMAIAGVEGEDVEQNIFYKIGAAAARGFKEGFMENFDLGDMLTGAEGGGPSWIGWGLGGIGLLKLLPKILLGGGRGGGGGAGAGGAAGGRGILGRLFGAMGGGAGTVPLQTWAGRAAGRAFQVGSRVRGIAPYNAMTQLREGEGPGEAMQRIRDQETNFIDRWFDDNVRDPIQGWFDRTVLDNEPPSEPGVTFPDTTPPTRRVDRPGGAAVGVRAGPDHLTSDLRQSSSRFDTAASKVQEGGGLVNDAAGRYEGAGTTMSSAAGLNIVAAGRIMRAADVFANTKIEVPDFTVIAGGGPPSPRSGSPTNQAPSRQQYGGRYTVRKPTLFMAGEAGEEDAVFIPKRGNAGGPGGAAAGITVQGPLIGQATISNEYDIKKVVADINREFEKVADNG